MDTQPQRNVEPGSPEEELQEIVEDAIQYKGVQVALPKPVIDYIEGLLEERSALRTELDQYRRAEAAQTAGPPLEEEPWIPVR